MTSDVGNIDCPGTCSHDYGSATSVVLTESPDVNSTFGSWGGCDSTTSTTCTIDVNAAKSITATFDSSDSVNPTASMDEPSSVDDPTNSIALAWSGDDGGGSGVADFDVRVRKAKYTTSTFGAYAPVLTGTSSTSTSFAVKPGFTYCFSVRATDNASNTGSYSADDCTMVPLDDKTMTHSSGWTQRTGVNGEYLGTISLSTTKNKTLTITGVHAKQLGLMAIGCNNCGKVSVTFGGKTWIANLNQTPGNYIFETSAFSSIKSGTLTIKITSSTAAAHKVQIDGVITLIDGTFPPPTRPTTRVVKARRL